MIVVNLILYQKLSEIDPKMIFQRSQESTKSYHDNNLIGTSRFHDEASLDSKI